MLTVCTYGPLHGKCLLILPNVIYLASTVNAIMICSHITLVQNSYLLLIRIHYRDITVSSDLRWEKHVSTVSSKATRHLNFIRRNICGCTSEVKSLAYTPLVRPMLECSTAAWDPYRAKDVNRLEMMERIEQLGLWSVTTGKPLLFPPLQTNLIDHFCLIDVLTVDSNSLERRLLGVWLLTLMAWSSFPDQLVILILTSLIPPLQLALML